MADRELYEVRIANKCPIFDCSACPDCLACESCHGDRCECGDEDEDDRPSWMEETPCL